MLDQNLKEPTVLLCQTQPSRLRMDSHGASFSVQHFGAIAMIEADSKASLWLQPKTRENYGRHATT
jgi:hypothetical protein